MNIEQARFNMIEQQIRPWEVLDPGVLSLLALVKREDFVPVSYTHLDVYKRQTSGRFAQRDRNAGP